MSFFKSTAELSHHNLRRKAQNKRKVTENPNESKPILYIDVLFGKALARNGVSKYTY
jgi:hypothetical protein